MLHYVFGTCRKPFNEQVRRANENNRVDSYALRVLYAPIWRSV